MAMQIILGGTGHVGSAVAERLISLQEAVTVVTRDTRHADALAAMGAGVAIVDVRDVDALRDVFRQGERAFVLNPPADPSTDTDRVERESAKAIIEALDGSGLRRIVLESTYGARAGEHNGDFGVLYEMEEALRAGAIPTTILRAAYYMTNWEMHLKSAREDGVLPSFFPADFALPMVSPVDLGAAAADLLLESNGNPRTVHVEGPERYSANHVADAAAAALGRDVSVLAIPRDSWVARFEQAGFSHCAALSYAEMTRLTIDEPENVTGDVRRGTTSLVDHMGRAVRRSSS